MGVVRSLTHKSNDHSLGHHIMLTGRSDAPAGFNPSAPTPTDHPSIAAIAGAVTTARNNLPPAIVLPERLIHFSGRVIPGQFAGVMGRARDPWFLEASLYEPKAYGAYPEYEFDHQQREYTPKRQAFLVPDLSLPEGVDGDRFGGRLGILRQIDEQRKSLEMAASAGGFGRSRADAVSLLTEARVRRAFDLNRATPKDLDRYGRNAFGWSLLMAARLVEAGVNLVQVNLGNNESWDTHGNAFPHLKDKLLPPTDQALSALLVDLEQRGLLDSTLIVMAGEFGRTPKISTLTQYYKGPGRDHWGAVQSVFLAGGGVKRRDGGRFVRQDRRLPRDRSANARELRGDDLLRARLAEDRRLARRHRPARTTSITAIRCRWRDPNAPIHVCVLCGQYQRTGMLGRHPARNSWLFQPV